MRWMSYFTHGVVDFLFYLWFGGCLMWWMSGVVDVCVVDVIQSVIAYSRMCNDFEKYPQSISAASNFDDIFVYL